MSTKKPRRLGASRSSVMWVLAIAVIVAAAIWWVLPSRTGQVVDVVLPDLSRPAQAGQKVFGENCAACHGALAGGTDRGPPLVHRIYHPSHHADAAFVLAAKRGVTSHHWNFGSMPPQPQIGERSIQQIIDFVRELQQANDIY